MNRRREVPPRADMTADTPPTPQALRESLAVLPMPLALVTPAAADWHIVLLNAALADALDLAADTALPRALHDPAFAVFAPTLRRQLDSLRQQPTRAFTPGRDTGVGGEDFGFELYRLAGAEPQQVLAVLRTGHDPLPGWIRHRLANPLTALFGNLDLLEGALGRRAEARTYLERAQQAAEALTTLLLRHDKRDDTDR